MVGLIWKWDLMATKSPNIGQAELEAKTSNHKVLVTTTMARPKVKPIGR
jgi:hypothetical protein